ncbi:cytochrome d ubiquinol oxidase subunit II [Streptomonospora litoralis]|uniref:Cytochrome bd-I ubiquinol oxidase subunit 2 n=1 Tax=Streptomonospora litoralis TaxID=2498135 RepID=A0A4P6Q5M8_9ACTN|nr:cytochrome d ubiquinol oxidase subunit II [Streptomonospora litoralis]QBI55590.1 Cytochrome bd-I ubiquinol oxidase subunit 2 [Streptomonospora litoralis]
MDIAAVVLLAGLVAGYLVLAGCDIGLGMLMPYVARTDAERRRAVSAMAPYFLGSEVWLLGAIGVTIGMFPAVKSAVIAGLWPAFVALLAGWLFRDAGLWLRGRMRGRAGRAVCDTWIVAGSWVLALSWGFAVGGMLGEGRLLSPFAIACALTSAGLFALRGAAFGAERLVPPGPGGDGAPRSLPRIAKASAAVEPAPAAAETRNTLASGGASAGSAGVDGVPSGRRRDSSTDQRAAAVRETATTVESAESADAAARVTRPVARAALLAGVLAAVAAPLPGGAVPDRPLAAAAAALVLLAALAATSGLSGPRLSRHTSALGLGSVPLLIAASVNLPIAPIPTGTALLFWSAILPVVPFIVVGQLWLYRVLRRPAPTSGFFA